MESSARSRPASQSAAAADLDGETAGTPGNDDSEKRPVAAWTPPWSLLRDWGVRLVTFAVLIVVWTILAKRTIPAILPSPGATITAAKDLLASGELKDAWLESLSQIAISMLVASVLGVGLGIVVGWFDVLDRLISPTLMGLFLMPRIALLPVIAVWFGYETIAKIVLIFVFSFFEIFFTVRNGVHTVEREYIELSRSYCVPQGAMLRRVILPAAFPYVIAGLRLGLVYALVGVVLAGFFLQSNGIGGLIFDAGSNFRTAELIVCLATIAIAGLAIDLGLKRLEQWRTPWKVNP